MHIALAQIRATNNPEQNLILIDQYCARAAHQNAQLVIFPEATMCCFGTRLDRIAQPSNGPWAQEVRMIAQQYHLTIIAGMFCPNPEGKIYNTLLVTGPHVEGIYHKIHLYDAYDFYESRTVSPGHHPVVLAIDGLQVGLTICYDIRFPALYTALAELGAHLIVVCASWASGLGKRRQWEILTAARALDTGCYLAAVDQAYRPGSSSVPLGIGCSCLIDPFGTPLTHAQLDPCLRLGTVDPHMVHIAQQRLGVLTNRHEFTSPGRQ